MHVTYSFRPLRDNVDCSVNVTKTSSSVARSSAKLKRWSRQSIDGPNPWPSAARETKLHSLSRETLRKSDNRSSGARIETSSSHRWSTRTLPKARSMTELPTLRRLGSTPLLKCSEHR